MGESRDYSDFSLSHGCCPKCIGIANSLGDAEIEQAERLARFQRELYEAGSANDIEAASGLVEAAAELGIRPLDVLIGLVAPILYKVGEDWKRDARSVRQEHLFTTFCEDVAGLVEARFTPQTVPGGPLVLLSTPSSNRHLLGPRLLALWLAQNGMRVHSAGPRSAAALAKLVLQTRPTWVLLSVSVLEQSMELGEMLEALNRLAAEDRPKVIVGGGAVKTGLLSSVCGAEIVPDINELLPLITADIAPQASASQAV